MNLQNQDQSIHKFLFRITPLEIIASKTSKNFKKSILIKLGTKSQKTMVLKEPINIQVDVLYSKTLKKYCPIKGIIKIYDVGEDGSQVISSVGGFQTQELLNQNKKQLLLQRDIGTSKLKMNIQIQNLSLSNNQPQKKAQQKSSKQNQTVSYQSLQKKSNTNSAKNIYSTPEIIKQEESYNTNNAPSNLKRASLANSNVNMTDQKQKHGIQLMKKQSQSGIQSKEAQKGYYAYQKNVSQKKSESLSQSGFSQTTFREKQLEELGEQLLIQRRLTKELQDKISKLHNKNQTYKQKIISSNKELTLCVNFFKKISDNVQYKNGKLIIQINEKQKMLSLKYKNRIFQKIFTDFVQFMISKLNDPNMRIMPDDQSQNFNNQKVSTATHVALQKMQQQYNSLTQQLKKKTSQLFTLRNKQRQFLNVETKLKLKQKQIQDMQTKLKQSQILKKSLEQVNQYLKQKDGQMELIIFNKQTSLQTYKQQVAELNITMKEMQASVENDSLIIQQLREEISNLSETVEQYRQKYGDLKTVKNRALQNELKQCLMWIDQQDKSIDIGLYQEPTEVSQKQKASVIDESINYFRNFMVQGLSKYQKQQIRDFKDQINKFYKKIQLYLKVK